MDQIYNSNKISLIFLFMLFTVSLDPSTTMANVFVRAGSSGTGISWNDALPTLPATLKRGETYYIAAGSYSSYTVDTPVSGTSLITIKKATIFDHGCLNCGWNDSYSSGQVVFAAPFNIITSYVIFDGVLGSLSSDPVNYGFKIAKPSTCSRENLNLIGIPPQGYSTMTLSNITISHVAMIHCGSSYDTFQNGIYSFPQSGTNITISHNYIKDASTNLLIRHWSNSIIEKNYFAGNWSSSHSHGQQISPALNSHDIIARNNIFINSTVFVIGVHQDDNYDWNIYNNIIIGGHMSGGFVNTDISSQAVPSIRKWNINHNTFINARFDTGGYGALTVGPLVDETTDRSFFYNNLFYNSYSPALNNLTYGTGAIIHQYNAYYATAGTFDSNEGGTAQVGTGDPLIDSESGNGRLKVHTVPGMSLGSPFDTDADGCSRTYRDRGAYEYNPAAVPAKVTGVTKIVNP